MARSVFTHPFRGITYEIIRGIDTAGFVTLPGRLPVMFIQRLPPRRTLTIELHEALHALEPHMAEAKVDFLSQQLGHWLWRLGYRK